MQIYLSVTNILVYTDTYMKITLYWLKVNKLSYIVYKASYNF